MKDSILQVVFSVVFLVGAAHILNWVAVLFFAVVKFLCRKQLLIDQAVEILRTPEWSAYRNYACPHESHILGMMEMTIHRAKNEAAPDYAGLEEACRKIAVVYAFAQMLADSGIIHVEFRKT